MLKTAGCPGLSGNPTRIVPCPWPGIGHCPALAAWTLASSWHRTSRRTLKGSLLLLMEVAKRYRDRSRLPWCLLTRESEQGSWPEPP